MYILRLVPLIFFMSFDGDLELYDDIF